VKPKIPGGWKLVPVESTGPMLNAAWNEINGLVGTGTIEAIWDAMLKNVPECDRELEDAEEAA
jgi:hypothetical protein